MHVTAKLEPLTIPTYPIGEPEKNPMFFEKRVYQGSCGKVYPVPFIDKVYDEPADVTYQSALLENDFVRLVLLPEIGGRIFIGQDKTNHDYDFFYRQDVIKPALVGLAGPWISGGVEFNWPQHHRPGTFMPADVFIEEEDDGARTVWLSEHDPLNRLKGMHGLRLRPGSSLVELRARLYNRTAFTRTFLWWANVAAMVHDQYQSFFPPDVHYVADHAVRAQSSFPIANNPYYGVGYQDRPGANDLSWYRNIPVPTSYMVCQTLFDFFGGYDFDAQGGFVHVADRHIAPGKKQWTWGNHDFGWAWDRELTDPSTSSPSTSSGRCAPYVELMAGVYTDNQPDFSYLLPYETKTFSQFWWPIQHIGPVQQANTKAALRLVIRDDRTIELGLCVSEPFEGELAIGRAGFQTRFDIALKPGESWQDSSMVFDGESPAELLAELRDASGKLVLSHRPAEPDPNERHRSVATEPPAPQDITSHDELYLTGEHLEQYRHPTRDPELYWNELLARDPDDARANTALGRRALDRGEFGLAEKHLRTAVSRLTSRHPNPVTGEAHYHLGLTLRWLGKTAEAEAALAKAAWNYEWRSSSHYQLATMCCQDERFEEALSHLDQALETNATSNKTHVLRAAIHRQLGNHDTARTILGDLLAVDPLDHWARYELASLDQDFNEFVELTRNDAQTMLDLVFDFCEAGFFEDAITLLPFHNGQEVTATAVPNPLERAQSTLYTMAWLNSLHPETAEFAPALLEAARAQSPDHFFPSRLEEMVVLQWALAQPGPDPLAGYALGNFHYDKKRHEDALTTWEAAKTQDADRTSPIAQLPRNLGIAHWNIHRDAEKARASYLEALALDPSDSRLVSEYDQLCTKLNDPLGERLAFLQQHRELVLERDDATVALATLHNLLGRPAEALALLLSRRFHPWEGGEGSVLRQYTTARLLLGEQALEAGKPDEALAQFEKAMDTPDSLGEKYHLLQAKADVNYWIGRTHRALGDDEQAVRSFTLAAEEAGDFSEMAVTAHSPLSWYRGLSLRELGRDEEARALFADLLSFGEAGLQETASIDYFATSLPNLLVFEEDLQARRDAEHHLLMALADHGLGNAGEARGHLDQTLAFTNADQRAADLAHQLTLTAG